MIEAFLLIYIWSIPDTAMSWSDSFEFDSKKTCEVAKRKLKKAKDVDWLFIDCVKK